MSVLRLATRAMGNAGLAATMIGVVADTAEVVAGEVDSAVANVDKVDTCVARFLLCELLPQHGDVCETVELCTLLWSYAAQICVSISTEAVRCCRPTRSETGPHYYFNGSSGRRVLSSKF